MAPWFHGIAETFFLWLSSFEDSVQIGVVGVHETPKVPIGDRIFLVVILQDSGGQRASTYVSRLRAAGR